MTQQLLQRGKNPLTVKTISYIFYLDKNKENKND